MARFDKYDPYGGNFRAYLAAPFTTADDLGKPFAVGLNSSGQIVKGAGQSGIVGVLILTKAVHIPAKLPVDVMKFGEVVEFAPTATTPGSGTGVAGTAYYANTTTGAISATGGAGTVKIGHTVEADRLIVSVDNLAAA